MGARSKDKDTATDAQLFRLSDIETREVSVVDRAANQRKFLIVKSEDAMAKKTPSTDPKAAETDEDKKKREQEAAAAQKAEMVECPKCGTKNFDTAKTCKDCGAALGGGDAGGDEDAAAGDDEAKAKDKEKRTKALAMPAAARDAALSAVTKACDQLITLAECLKAAPAGDAIPEALAAEVMVAVDALGGIEPVGKAIVGKANEKVKAKRVEQVKAALTGLTDLVKELEGAVEAVATGTADALSETAKAELAKRDGVIADLRTRLSSVEKSIGAPASTATGTTPTAKGASGDDADWPMDMNRPLDRKTVTEKKKPFFGKTQTA